MNSTRLSEPTDLELFRAIVEQTADAIIFADRDGVIRVWNRGGLTGSSLRGTTPEAPDSGVRTLGRLVQWLGLEGIASSAHRQANAIQFGIAQQPFGHGQELRLFTRDVPLV